MPLNHSIEAVKLVALDTVNSIPRSPSEKRDELPLPMFATPLTEFFEMVINGGVRHGFIMELSLHALDESFRTVMLAAN